MTLALEKKRTPVSLGTLSRPPIAAGIAALVSLPAMAQVNSSNEPIPAPTLAAPSATPVPTAPSSAPASSVEPSAISTPANPSPTIAPVSEAANLTLKGTVLAKGKGNPIKGALVFWEDNREKTAETKADGSFEIEVPKGEKRILVRADGFDEISLLVSNGVAPENGVVRLEPAAALERGGVIRARRKTEVSQQSLQREEMTRIPGTGGDAVRALQTLPSVLATNPGSAEITVRGSAPGDNRYFVDRNEVPFVFHLGGLGTVVPTRALEGVDLYPGGFSSLYSDAIGGIIQLRVENKIPDRTSGQAELSLLQSSVYLEGNLFGTAKEEKSSPENAQSAAPPVQANQDDRIGYRAGFRRTYLEAWAPLIKKFVPEERLSFTTLPQATDYQFFLNGNHSTGTWQGYLFGAANRLSLAAKTRFSDAEDGRSSFSVFNYFQTSGVRYNTNLGNGWGLTISPQQRYFLIDNKFFDNFVKVTSNRFSVETALDKRFTSALSATVGVRPEYERVVTDVDAIQLPAGGNADLFFDPDTAPRNSQSLVRNQYYGNVFFDLTWKPVSDWTLNPGVTLQKGRTDAQFEVDPRFNTRLALNDTHALKAAWGYYSQMPEPAYDSEDYGNPNLKLERAIHYVAGWETKFGGAWETDVQVYYKDMFNLVGNATENPEKIYENNIIGRSKGFETFVKRQRTGRWSGWLSYGYSKSERRDPRSKVWRVFDFDKTHSVNLVGAYKITGQWEIGSKAQYLTGAATTSIPGGTFNQTTGRYVPNRPSRDGSLEANDSRLPETFQLDVRTDYDFLFDTWTLNTYLEITNVTNRANIVATNYSPDYSKREYVTGTPLLPNLGVIAKF
jgi:hypothetical protein